MASAKSKKVQEALEQLNEVLHTYRSKKSRSRGDFLAAAKAFEVAVEYCWRDLKRTVEDEGLDAPSPKAAVREAAKLGIITSPEEWLDCINARNDSVHDYFSIGEEDYIKLAEKFALLAKRLFPK